MQGAIGKIFHNAECEIKKKTPSEENLERGMPLRTISTFVAKGKEPLQPDH